MTKLEMIPITKLQESKTNPRQFFDPKGMTELIASINEKGIITPLLVRQIEGDLRANRPYFEIIAGARRYRAARELELKEAPAVVREMTDAEALELQVIENDQRADVHPLEQCAGYQQLMKANLLTVEELATRVGKSVAYVQRRLRFATLIEPIRALFSANKITIGHATLAARLQPDQQKETLSWLKNGESIEDYAENIERNFFLVLKDAPFPTTDETLVPKAGSCINCPKRTGFNKALFEDIKNQDTCTDPECFQEKTRAFIKRQVGTHKDAVLLTVGDYSYSSEKPKGLTGWTIASSKVCPDTKEGIVVQKKFAHETGAKLGQVITVCTNSKCKTHHPKQTVPDYNPATGGSRTAEKKRRLELKRKGLVFSLLASAELAPKDTDYRAILDWAVDNLSHDSARSLGQAMKWEAPVKFASRDWRGCVERELKKITGKDVHKWLLLVMLADTELWTGRKTLLETTARRKGINLAKIAKLARAPKQKQAKTGRKGAAKPVNRRKAMVGGTR
jgi:ParB family chromosome partitioning protein